MANNFYSQSILGGGVNLGRTLIQAKGAIGGMRHVFVKLQGGADNGLVFPTVGGVITNPFPGPAKAFAGDLAEYNPGIESDEGATVKLLKTYELKTAAESSTTIEITRTGFSHIPFVGDIIMIAPDEIDGTGTPSVVTAVEATTNDDGDKIWSVTVDAAISGDAEDVLVECDSDGNPIVTNPNVILPCDYDFLFNPSASISELDGARYFIAPILASEDVRMYTAKMQALPASVKALNKSKVTGWFNL